MKEDHKHRCVLSNYTISHTFSLFSRFYPSILYKFLFNTGSKNYGKTERASRQPDPEPLVLFRYFLYEHERQHVQGKRGHTLVRL